MRAEALALCCARVCGAPAADAELYACGEDGDEEGYGSVDEDYGPGLLGEGEAEAAG